MTVSFGNEANSEKLSSDPRGAEYTQPPGRIEVTLGCEMRLRTVRFSGRSSRSVLVKKPVTPSLPPEAEDDGQKRLSPQAYTRVATEENTTNGRLRVWRHTITGSSARPRRAYNSRRYDTCLLGRKL